MKPVLIVYATRHGQTRRIADHLAAQVRQHGLQTDVIDCSPVPRELPLDAYSAAILCASVHLGRHEKEMVQFVKRYRDGLRRLPNAFVSVSLAQAGVQDSNWTPERRAQARADTRRLIQEFATQTEWQPDRVHATAGAIRYTEYNWLLRMLMVRIARKAGVSTDTSRDHEFTDWRALNRLAAQVAERVAERVPLGVLV